MKSKEIILQIDSQPVVYEKFLDRRKIQERIREMGRQIGNDYKGKELRLVGVLNGALFFLTDLSREIKNPLLTIDTISVSSYGMGTVSNRQPRILSDLKDPITGIDTVVVEDIIDTGYSLSALLEMLKARNPKSLELAALFSKPERREVDVPVKYIGFEIPNSYAIGMGLDDAGLRRQEEHLFIRKRT